MLALSGDGHALENNYFRFVGDSGVVTASAREDHDGIVWLGTANGPISYDGRQLKHLNPTRSPRLSKVGAITVTRDGRIWFGRVAGGVVVYDKRDLSFQNYTSGPDETQHLSSDQMNWAPQLIAEAADGTVWVGTQFGLNRIDPKSHRVWRYVHDAQDPTSLVDNNIWSVFIDRQNRLWVGTAQGLSMQAPGQPGFRNFRHRTNDNTSLPDDYVYAVAQSPDDRIWIGTRHAGLVAFDADSERFTAMPHSHDGQSDKQPNEVFSISATQSGELLLGRSIENPHGFEVFDTRTKVFTRMLRAQASHDAERAEAAMSAIEGRDGTIWLPYNHGQLYQLGKRPILQPLTLTGAQETPRAAPILTFAEDENGTIWLGGSGGVYRFNPKLDSYSLALERATAGDKNARLAHAFGEVNSLLPAGREQLWVGEVDLTFTLVNTNTGQVLRRWAPPSPIGMGAWSATFDPRDKRFLWIATQTAGLVRLDTETGRYERFNAEHNPTAGIKASFISSITHSDDGLLWIAAWGQGLLKFDGQKVVATTGEVLHETDGQPCISTSRVMRDRRGRWWLASVEDGLHSFEPQTGKLKRVGPESGLSSNMIYGLSLDPSGKLWVGTSDRIYLFDPDLSKVITSYEAQNVLSVRNMLSWPSGLFVSSKGLVFVGALSGAGLIDPTLQPPLPQSANVLLTSLTQNSIPLDLGTAPEMAQKIVLQWPNNTFEFTASVLGDSMNLEKKIRFRLDGLESDWYQPASAHNGRYSLLPEGTYELQLQGEFGQVGWGPARKLQVVVTPPFWREPWFRALMLCLFATALILGWALYQRRAAKILRRLEALVDLRTQDLRSSRDEAAAVGRELLLKSTELERLNQQLEQRVTERTEALTLLNEQLTFENEHDLATGLLNRKSLLVELKKIWQHTDATKSIYILLLIDIDQFKTYNETLGHLAADYFVQAYAQRLRNHFVGSAKLFRLSADQFVVLQPVQDAAIALRVAKDLLQLLSSPIRFEGHAHAVMCSIGVTATNQQHVRDPGTLLQAADVALGLAKNRGGNDIEVADPNQILTHEKMRTTQMRLKQAFENLNENNFLLPHYQSVVDARTRCVAGYEILARWSQGSGTDRLEPKDFIPAAIATGCTHNMDLSILSAVADQLDDLGTSAYFADLQFLNVNIFSTGFRRPDFVDAFVRMVERIQAHGITLNIELTEQAPAEDLVNAAHALKSLGAGKLLISVDDFGTGNSSLAHLMSIHPDLLKIDQTFVAGIGIDPGAEGIIKATVAMARSLNISLIAEGVETTAQADYLQAVGCHYLQGYLFDRPRALNDVL